MPVKHTFREKMDYLVRTTGKDEADIVAQAVEKGLLELYREQIKNMYIAGKFSREHAVAELGEELVADIDFARQSIEKDVKWGLDD